VKTQDSQVFISYLILTSTDKSITDTQRYYYYFFIPLGDYVSKSHFFMIYGAFVLHHSFLYRCCHNLIVSPCAKQTWATVIHLFWACENL